MEGQGLSWLPGGQRQQKGELAASTEGRVKMKRRCPGCLEGGRGEPSPPVSDLSLGSEVWLLPSWRWEGSVGRC